MEEKIYFARAFDRIGNGESADLVFRIKRGPGDKARDDTQKKKISLIFQLVATAILPKATANDRSSSRAFAPGNDPRTSLRMGITKGRRVVRE